MIRRCAAALAAAGLALALTSGCGVLTSGLRGVDLPGGADLGDRPYSVTVEFADVVDLVPQSLVKVADVAVGSVREVRLDPATWRALVTVDVNGDVRLPANAVARVRTTSLLGEKFVQLGPPPSGATGTLSDGARIPIERSGRAVEVEEVFGALAMLLDGGGVGNIRTIAVELNQALEGNELEIRSLLENLDTLVRALDGRKGDITRAIDGLNRLAATLDEGRPKIENALQDLGPGIEELAAQREQLVDMLQSLDRLSTVALDVVDRSREDLLADLRMLRPTLEQLAAAEQNLPRSLEVLASPPFTDAAADGFAGDFSNLYADIYLDLGLDGLLKNILNGGLPALPGLPANAQLLAPLLGAPTAPELPLLGALPGLGGGPATSADRQEPEEEKEEDAQPERRGGLFGGLFGGGG
ncbi:MCE family protein [Pseudonocardia thermophila]|jgi:virulence factor Mce family protein|uniref:MCE family protein n=1 Tax=Pseudonocardia thermophila TaxID=1848 RepID=UPI00248DDD8C|nr:MCE family protein [Pseudonocardia thermophila]